MTPAEDFNRRKRLEGISTSFEGQIALARRAHEYARRMGGDLRFVATPVQSAKPPESPQ